MKKLYSLFLGLILAVCISSLAFSYSALMMMGGSDTVVEDETGYGDYRISLVDGQSWFGGDNLAADLFDAGKGIFTSGTYSWTVYGTNTIANVSNALAITWVDDAAGAHLEWADAEDLSSDLTIGTLYKVQFDASINTGSAEVHIYNQAGSSIDSVTVDKTSLQTFVIYFVATHATGDSMRMANMGAGEVLTLDNITIQAVTSPALYADTGAFIRVCDSGGTDAANCATGYIGEAGTGETLGGELLSNPTFDVNTTGWTAFLDVVLASVAGGVSNNAIRLTVGASTNPYAFQAGSNTVNKEYKMGGWVKQGTESTYRLYSSWTGYENTGITDETESTATWARKEWYGVAAGLSERMILRIVAAGGAGTTLFFDEMTFKEVTEPTPNSVMIRKTPGGVEGWLKIGATFDPNAISTFTISQ